MDEEKWIGWNDAKRERIRVKIKNKRKYEGGGVKGTWTTLAFTGGP